MQPVANEGLTIAGVMVHGQVVPPELYEPPDALDFSEAIDVTLTGPLDDPPQEHQYVLVRVGCMSYSHLGALLDRVGGAILVDHDVLMRRWDGRWLTDTLLAEVGKCLESSATMDDQVAALTERFGPLGP